MAKRMHSTQTSPTGETLQQDGPRWLLRATDGDASGATGLVPALDKALTIIAYLNEPRAQQPALPEIVQATGVTRSHCHAILKTLVAHGWLAFDSRSKAYQLSPGVLKYVSSVVQETGDLDLIRPVLQRLAHQIRMPVMIARPMADGSFVVIDKFTAQHVLEISFPVGYRFPRDACAHMRANLAWRKPHEIDTWFRQGKPKRYTQSSVVDESAVREELQMVRARGYARSAGEFTDGLMAIAQPILGRDGVPEYIVSSSSLLLIMKEKEEDVARAMKQAIADIHSVLGSSTLKQSTATV